VLAVSVGVAVLGLGLLIAAAKFKLLARVPDPAPTATVYDRMGRWCLLLGAPLLAVGGLFAVVAAVVR
jgi:hypothetical protein